MKLAKVAKEVQRQGLKLARDLAIDAFRNQARALGIDSTTTLRRMSNDQYVRRMRRLGCVEWPWVRL